ncbi:hypothetical protein D9M68_684970 [compost metagenome]
MRTSAWASWPSSRRCRPARIICRAAVMAVAISARCSASRAWRSPVASSRACSTTRSSTCCALATRISPSNSLRRSCRRVIVTASPSRRLTGSKVCVICRRESRGEVFPEECAWQISTRSAWRSSRKQSSPPLLSFAPQITRSAQEALRSRSAVPSRMTPSGWRVALRPVSRARPTIRRPSRRSCR